MRGGPAPRTGLALACAGTVWLCALSWRGFTEAWAATLVPLLGLGLVVALTGAGLRRLTVPGPLVVLAQLLASGAAASLVLTGSPVPLGDAGARLAESFSLAAESATRYAAPVPASAPGIEPLLVTGGLGCLLLVDLLACTLRRVPLAGLPLLAVYSVPVSVLGSGASWWVFVVGAAGFLLMLHLDAGDAVTRWGRALPHDAHGSDDPVDADGFGVRTGAATAGAGALGAVALALAVGLPLLLPTAELDLLGGGSGGDDGREISVENPMVDLRRDLKQGGDFPLVRVRTEDPDPSYLRISVLANFTQDEWTSGDRSVPGNQVADGALPPIEGLDPQVPREAYTYDVEVTDDFSSSWLPTQAPVSRVVADGDWRYDRTTSDFIAAGEDLDTAGISYEMTAVEPDLDVEDLQDAPAESGQVDDRFLELPTDLPPIVNAITDDVTVGLANDYDRAVALQQFFREDGGFRYSLEDSGEGNGGDDLAAFLNPGPDGRVGYCEQFAAAMAVMAREVGIPSRVAVGFLEPRDLGGGTWEYSARDLHAWPELYFPGAGWTRFEPTPPQRASEVPAYATGRQQAEALPEVDATPDQEPGERADRAENRPEPQVLEDEPDPVAPAADGSVPWVVPAAGAVALLLAVLLVLPGVVRRRRREARLAGGPEDCWAELRDTALDLGVPWPDGRSPREVRAALSPHLRVHDDLDLLVRAVEQTRYARPVPASSADVGGPAGTGEAAGRCVESLEALTSSRKTRRATLWPRSVVSPSVWRRRRSAAAEDGATDGAVATRRPAEQLR